MSSTTPPNEVTAAASGTTWSWTWAATGPSRQLRRCLTPHGTLVLVGGEGGGRIIGAAMARSLRAVAWSPFIKQSLRMVLGTTTADDLQTLTDLVDSGKIRPVIDRVYPLSEAATPSGISTTVVRRESSSSPSETAAMRPRRAPPNPRGPSHRIPPRRAHQENHHAEPVDKCPPGIWLIVKGFTTPSTPSEPTSRPASPHP